MSDIFESLRQLNSVQPIDPHRCPYITCNEQNQQSVLKLLASQSAEVVKGSRLHVGFSVWFNLDVIATTKPDYAVLFDIDPAVLHFVYPSIQKAITSANSREEFINHLVSAVEKDPLMSPIAGSLKTDLSELSQSGYGFLASEDNFQFVKAKFAANAIYFGQMNLAIEDNIDLLMKWIKENHLQLDTLYLSNIPEWIINQHSKENWRPVQQAIQSLMTPSTRLIDAFYPTTSKEDSGPPQRLNTGEMPEYVVRAAKRDRDRSLFTGQPTGALNFDDLDSPEAKRLHKKGSAGS